MSPERTCLLPVCLGPKPKLGNRITSPTGVRLFARDRLGYWVSPPSERYESRDFHPTIQLVDDEAEFVDIVAITMRGDDRFGRFKILKAYDGQEALEQYLEHEPWLVLLNVMMPRRTGLEVLRAIRKERSEAETPVILTSISPATRHRDFIRRMGANDYLVKPAPAHRVLDLIAEYL